MRNSTDIGGVIAQRATTAKTLSSCRTCPAMDSILHDKFYGYSMHGVVDCKLLDGMVNGSLINTRELVRKILANNPEIQCPVIASANRLITTVERVIDQALSQQLKDLEAKAKEEAAKAGATSAPSNPEEASLTPSDSTEAAVAVPTNLDEQATLASTPTGEEAAQS
ncbi:MAG TPA: hypothetical protein PK398_02310 [Candidatus Gracilibacteria bacterium]|nr:hypothetical protein [Candidatus Gracilibacteria bacterium]